jgi:hypothetical protein
LRTRKKPCETIAFEFLENPNTWLAAVDGHRSCERRQRNFCQVFGRNASVIHGFSAVKREPIAEAIMFKSVLMPIDASSESQAVAMLRFVQKVQASG